MMTLVLALSAAGGLAQVDVAHRDPVAAMESMTLKAIEKSAASVVAIRVEREPEPPKAAPAPTPRRPGPFGRGLLPGMPEDVFAKRPVGAWCSGVVAESDGLILTTHFNVSGKVKSIEVMLPDGRRLPARLLGFNGTYDLAALKVEAEGLAVAEKAPLDGLKAGQAVIALGRAPDGRGLTVNPGIVSAAARLGGRGIQTDARLNYGNVGGPLVDAEGRWVAVTCKVDVRFSSTRGQNSGVGYAITHDRFPELLADLKAGRSVAESRRPLLGIGFKTDSKLKGVELDSVAAGGAAEKAGIKAGDVIVEFDGKEIQYFEELKGAISRHAPGDKVSVKVLREGAPMEFECELGWDDRGE